MNATTTPPRLAIIMPCYNEEAIIATTYAAITRKLATLIAQNKAAPESFVCFVDDGSKDKTVEILLALKNGENSATPSLRGVAHAEAIHENKATLAKMDCFEPNGSRNDEFGATPQPLILKLAKNYGHQSALLAGLEFVKDRCECAVSLDCDLQQDINAIDEMLAHFSRGCEIVYGVRKAYAHESALKKYTSRGFYKFMQLLGVRLLYNHADYRLMSARAIKNLLEFSEVNLFLRGIVPLLGLKSAVVHYEQLARTAGESKYPLAKMLGFAMNGITSFSIAPLRALSALGVVLCALCVVYGGYALYMKLFTAEPISGWTSTVLIVLFLGGAQFLGLGIVGEYIGKIYAEVKRRPRYFVESVL